MVCGEDGKKMSKSLGNYVEAKDVIGRYSVDALRQWAALSGATGNDNAFYWKDVQYAQSFINKLWNASKFAERALDGYDTAAGAKAELRLVDRWVLSRLNKTVRQCTKAMEDRDFYSAITAIHSFFWHEFCDYYLEDVKHRVYGDAKTGKAAPAASRLAAQRCVREALLKSLKLLAPFAPYAAEEVFHSLFAQHEKAKSVHVSEWPAAEEEYLNENAENISNKLHSILSQIRKFKASRSLALNERLSLVAISAPELLVKELAEVEEEIRAVGKAERVEFKHKESGVEEVEISV